jgi:hypothetical protein
VQHEQDPRARTIVIDRPLAGKDARSDQSDVHAIAPQDRSRGLPLEIPGVEKAASGFFYEEVALPVAGCPPRETQRRQPEGEASNQANDEGTNDEVRGEIQAAAAAPRKRVVVERTIPKQAADLKLGIDQQWREEWVVQVRRQEHGDQVEAEGAAQHHAKWQVKPIHRKGPDEGPKPDRHCLSGRLCCLGPQPVQQLGETPPEALSRGFRRLVHPDSIS